MGKIRLQEIDTRAPEGRDKKETKEKLAEILQELDQLQNLLYAESKHSLLVVIQGMDASGKDGVVRNVFGKLNPQGVLVRSFKVPTADELAHDFLWRIHAHAPAKGVIQLFNRSHYEDVLVTRVHKQVSDKLVKERFQQIVDFERTLFENNVTVLKFFLHISREEQTRRLAERLADPDKRWKISEADFAERGYWPQYTRAYQDAIENTSRSHAPWFIIPSDHKWYRNAAISEILVNAIGKLKMKYPKPSFDPSKVKL